LREFETIQLIGEADSVPSARKVIKSLSPDLVFLDIDLGHQLGFDLLEGSEKKFHTIFVTAYDEYAIRAFEINALDYLLKPVHPDRLKESISRLGSPVQKKLNFKLEPYDKIWISGHYGSKFVRVDSINFIEARGDYSLLCTKNAVHGLVHHTLKLWMERLPADMFIQVHRSYIVNMDRIKEIKQQPTERHAVSLEGELRLIPVSRSYLRKLKDNFRVD
jgi:two-component system LytT family response regulator